MDVKEAIVGRRNVKQFKADEIERDQLLRWLDTARYAPNHRMVEPWQVVVVGPDARAALHHGANFGDAPVVLAFLSKTAEHPVDRDENIIATACFVQNFCLAAWSDGVGTRWTSIGTKPGAREILQVPEGYEVVVVLGVGYPAEVPVAKERTPIAEKLRELG
ncbi:MAG: nitroreductase family protein [Alicyclobacillus sp.]|nr:nitroreductase family protein [Alicyclobacillus sp.]